MERADGGSAEGLTDYQRGWADAMTEAARIVNRFYSQKFHDPFHRVEHADLLVFSRQFKDSGKEPPTESVPQKAFRLRDPDAKQK